LARVGAAIVMGALLAEIAGLVAEVAVIVIVVPVGSRV
jgi:hypothetical protein